MKHVYITAICALPLATLLLVPLSSCSSDSSTNAADTGPGGTDTGTGSDTGTGDTKDGGDAGRCAILPFTPPPADPGKNTILFSVSGESLALTGYAFPPATDTDPAFVDGWEVTFTRLLVTVDKLVLSANPDKDPANQSKTDAIVAEVDGPWAVDLQKGGPLLGKGGGDDKAVPIAALLNQNKAGGAPFDASQRYAIGFDTVVAKPNAMNVNLDADGLCDYQDMIANGFAVLYVGSARFKGGASCKSPTTGYAFNKLPPRVDFKLGFKSPTSYVNCQNGDIQSGTAFPGEEHVRGVQTDAAKFVIVEITYHTDPPFWESVVRDSDVHFDQIAAQYIGVASPTATVEDFAGVAFTPFKDKSGVNLPWRSCLPTYVAKAGAMRFDPQTVPVNPSGTPDKALRDYRDFMTYVETRQAHLNADGICYVAHNYPSP